MNKQANCYQMIFCQQQWSHNKHNKIIHLTIQVSYYLELWPVLCKCQVLFSGQGKARCNEMKHGIVLHWSSAAFRIHCRHHTIWTAQESSTNKHLSHLVTMGEKSLERNKCLNRYLKQYIQYANMLPTILHICKQWFNLWLYYWDSLLLVDKRSITSSIMWNFPQSIELYEYYLVYFVPIIWQNICC